MRIKIQQLFINIFFYVVPAGIAIWRHAQASLEYKRSLLGIIIAIFIGYLYLKKKNKIMRIKETKEIEDDKRTVKNILYWYTKFATIYLVGFVTLFYVQFNFQSLTFTMELIAGSLIIGALLRINLASNSGY